MNEFIFISLKLHSQCLHLSIKRFYNIYYIHGDTRHSIFNFNIITGDNMIRKFKNQDLDKIMELWLNTNISAHSFIEKQYWKSNFDEVKRMMPQAEIYVYEENGDIQGFIGLMNEYIAGIFVSSQHQSKGIGKMLLDYAKKKRDRLDLSVYQENEKAVRFYHRENFAVEKEHFDENTGEIELKMSWSKRANIG